MAKILIIEDEPEHIALVKMRLEAAGFEVTAALTGAEGIEAAAELEPDLILTDLLLPDLEPAAMIHKLRAAAAAPIVAFTALDPFEIDRRQLRRELAGVIAKPYEPAQLLAEINRFLGR